MYLFGQMEAESQVIDMWVVSSVIITLILLQSVFSSLEIEAEVLQGQSLDYWWIILPRFCETVPVGLTALVLGMRMSPPYQKKFSKNLAFPA